MQLPPDVLALARVEPVAPSTALALSELTGATREQLLRRLGRRLGTRERRTAAATLHLGLVGRLWTLTLGGLPRDGVPDLRRVRWWDDDGSLRLQLPPELSAVEVPLAHYVLDLASPVGDTLATGLARGNVASSLVSTARLLGIDPGPHLTGALAGALDPEGRRRSCCLFYRVPGGGVCSDCCLRAPVR